MSGSRGGWRRIFGGSRGRSRRRSRRRSCRSCSTAATATAAAGSSGSGRRVAAKQGRRGGRRGRVVRRYDARARSSEIERLRSSSVKQVRSCGVDSSDHSGRVSRADGRLRQHVGRRGASRAPARLNILAAGSSQLHFSSCVLALDLRALQPRCSSS